MLKPDQIVKVDGQTVRIISVDPDPRCDVWGCLTEDPDQSIFFQRSDIEND